MVPLRLGAVQSLQDVELFTRHGRSIEEQSID
jgi:hypothetical protein